MEKDEIVDSHPQAYHFDWKSMVRSAILMAVIATLSLAAYMVIITLMFESISTGALFLQYILLYGFINVYLIIQKRNTGFKEGFVSKGLIAGATLSMMIAILFFIVEAIIYQFNPEATVARRFGSENQLGSSPIMVFAAVSMEMFVMGMLGAFVAFQYLKRNSEKSGMVGP